MRTPILKQGHYLIATLQKALTDADLEQLREELAAEVRRHRSSGVVLDVALLDVVDSFAARTLRNMAHVVKLLGAETVVVGIQPDVAFSMVRLGLTLAGVETALDLEEGLAALQRLEHGEDDDAAA